MKLVRNTSRNFQLYFNEQEFTILADLKKDIKTQFVDKSINTDEPLDKIFREIDTLTNGESCTFVAYMLIYKSEYKAFRLRVIKCTTGYVLLHNEILENIDVYFNPISKKVSSTDEIIKENDIIHENNAFFTLMNRLYNLIDDMSDDWEEEANGEHRYMSIKQFEKVIGNDFVIEKTIHNTTKQCFVMTFKIHYKNGDYKGNPHLFFLHYHKCPNDIIYIDDVKFTEDEDQPMWKATMLIRA